MPRNTVTIVVKAPRRLVVAMIHALPAVLRGRAGVDTRLTDTVLVRMGLTVQRFTSQAFRQKANGGADASGLYWKPLSRYTIQKKRRTAPANAKKILREFNHLVTSLEPALRPMNATPTPPVRPLQVFRLRPGQVTIGTSRPHANQHHTGRGRPLRRLWPHPRQWPNTWWSELLNQTRMGTIAVLTTLLGGRTP
jgi:hypothetical protein